MRAEAARVHLAHPQGFNVGGGVALVVVEVGERGGAAVGLLAVPDADVVDVGSGNEKQARAERLVPVGRGAEFVDGDVGELGGRFAAAIGAGGIGGVGRIGDAGEGLAVALGRAVEAGDERGAVRGLPVGAGCVAHKAGRVDLVGRAVVAGFVEAADAREEAQRAAVVLGKKQPVLAVDVAGGVDGAALRGSFLDEAVGADEAAGASRPQGPCLVWSEQAGVVGAFAAVAGAEFGLAGGGPDGNELMTPPMALEP